MTTRTNTNAKRPPTAIDAEDKGYGVGSRWYDVLHGRKYTCRDGTKNAAIWTEDYADVTDAASVQAAGAIVSKSNLVASVAPTANDDSNGGYAVASRWFDITNDKEYVCLDATAGAAVWLETTGTAGAGDMLKATYDPNDDGVIAVAQTEADVTADNAPQAHDLNSHNSCTLAELSADISDATLIDTMDVRLFDARYPTAHNQDWSTITGEPAYCTRWAAWTEVTSKPSTFPPSAHNQSAATITSGTLPVARGGTGVTGDTYDARYVNGCDTGAATGRVYKVPAFDGGEIFYGSSGNMSIMSAGTNGYQLTTHAMGNAPTWAAASDLIFSDTHCPKCGLEFQDGDDLILHVIGHNEVGDILTIPMHKECAEAPKKTVMIKRKVMEDQYVLDELTGEPKVQRVQKMQEKTVTKHKMKEGYILDNASGKALKIDVDGKVGKTKHNLSEALETVEEMISEVMYEDVEFTL